jgi:hypothetical protein
MHLFSFFRGSQASKTPAQKATLRKARKAIERRQSGRFQPRRNLAAFRAEMLEERVVFSASPLMDSPLLDSALASTALTSHIAVCSAPTQPTAVTPFTAPVPANLASMLAAAATNQIDPVLAPDTNPAVFDSYDTIDSHTNTPIAEFNFSDSARWSSTSSNTGYLAQGDATTITWSVVPDGTAVSGFNGEPAAPSNLRSFLAGIYGSNATSNKPADQPWFPVLKSTFDRWSALSGITYVYQAADDGAALGGSTPGVNGVRGDVRLSGHYIDGNSNVLAYTFYPTVGDMVIDTGDNFYGSTGSNSLRLRNTVAHELGHAIGLGHVQPVNGTKLMEPYISLNYDGPQEDDILAANRGYGDPLEKNGGNDTAAKASPLAVTNNAFAISGVSIDNVTDTDWYSVTVGGPTTLSVTLDPTGTTYQLDTGSFNAKAQSDLALAIYGGGGSALIASANLTGAGSDEVLNNVNLASAGTYYFKVTGAASAAQMYQLTGSVTSSVPAPEITVLSGTTALTDGQTVSFGSTTPGAPLSQTFTIKNDGSQTLTLSPISAASLPAGFTLTSNIPVTSLAPGATTTFTIRLDATSIGTYGGAISFSNNDSDENPFDLVLSGAVSNVVVSGASGLYRLDEISGTTAVDSSGSGNNGVYVNSPTLGVSGVISGDSAVALNGTNQYVTLPSQAFGAYGNAVSFETWFNAPVGSSGVILGQVGSGTPGSGQPYGYVPVVALGTDGKLRSSMFWHGSVNSRVVSPGTTAYNDGNWHHVAVTYASGIETLYIDGVAAGSQTASQVAYNSTYSYFLGTGYTNTWTGGNGGWQYFQGSLDEAAVYQRAMSAAEVAQHYAAGNTQGTPAPEITMRQGSTSLTDGQAVNFGTTNQGTPVSQTFTITNNGNATLTLTALDPAAMPAGFALTSNLGSTSLAAGQSTSFTVQLTATAAGSYSGAIHLASNDSNENPFDLTLSGSVTAVAPKLGLSQGGVGLTSGQMISFGTTPTGTPVSKAFTITNSGNATLTLTALDPNSLPAGFALTSNIGNTSLAAGQSTSFTLQLSAAAAGSYSGVIHLASNDSSQNPFDISLSGTVNSVVVGGASASYRLDETSGTTAVDSSGSGNSGTYVNSPTLGVPGVISGDTAVGLNGTNQYVSLPSQAFGAYGNAVSFETWFNAPVGGSGVILGQVGSGTPGSGQPYGYVPVLQLGTDGKLRSSMFWHGSVNSRVVSPGTTTYNDGNWHHIAVTYAGGIETLYIDGAAAGSQTASQVAYNSTYSYFLGTGYTNTWSGGNGGWQYFKGSLDEAAVYQRALSAAEVAQHYAAGNTTGTPAPAPEITIRQGSTNLTDGQTVGFGTTNQGTPVSQTFIITNDGNATLTLTALDPAAMPAGFALSSNLSSTALAPGQSTSFAVQLAATAAGSYSGTIHLANNDRDENPFDLTLAGTVSAVATISPTASYRLDEPSGTTAVDSSGNGYNGTYVNNPTLGVTGAVSGDTAIGLNGTNQYVSLPSQAFGTYGSAVSFETWFNAPLGSSGVILGQVGSGTPGSGQPYGYVPVLQLGTDGKLRSSMFWHGDVNARVVSAGTATYNDGAWHHVAVTYANGIETLYIDGVLAGSQATSQVTYNGTYNYFLGAGYTSGWSYGNGGWQFFKGSLDEVAIYQGALSAADVAQQYAAQKASALAPSTAMGVASSDTPDGFLARSILLAEHSGPEKTVARPTVTLSQEQLSAELFVVSKSPSAVNDIALESLLDDWADGYGFAHRME